MRIVRRLMADRSGVTAVIFGLAAVPLVALVGAAVDYSRATGAQTAIQRAADATALRLARDSRLGVPLPDPVALVADLHGVAGLEGLRVVGRPEGVGRYRVEVEGRIPTTIGALLVPAMEIGVTAVAVARQPRVRTFIETANLDPEADDYNELRAYCFDPTRNERNGPLVPDHLATAEDERMDFVKISDNTPEGVARAPQRLVIECLSHETVSFQLVNIRDARRSEAARLTNPRWEHFTDTTIVDGVERYNTRYRDLIESILCETREACRPRAQGGILPNNNEKHRTPAVNARACVAGQYLYLGWEDRPPHIGDWTDQDYDDIRLVMSCPLREEGAIAVRLVR